LSAELIKTQTELVDITTAFDLLEEGVDEMEQEKDVLEAALKAATAGGDSTVLIAEKQQAIEMAEKAEKRVAALEAQGKKGNELSKVDRQAAAGTLLLMTGCLSAAVVQTCRGDWINWKLKSKQLSKRQRLMQVNRFLTQRQKRRNESRQLCRC
jgi:hypothetical protein